MALDTNCLASFMLFVIYTVTNKIALEFVIMLNVVAPFGGGAF
jgi:hypothetical protein